MPRADGIVRAEIVGDEALRKRIRKVRRAVPDEVDRISLDVAEILVPFVRRKIPLGPARNGHVKYSVEAKKRARGPVIDAGGPAFPYYGWLEFGGRVGINRSVFREKEPDGRYIYPTVYERRALIEHEMKDGLDDLMRRYGFEVRG